MIELKTPQDHERLRRIALSAQGLLKTRPFGRGLDATRSAIEHLGYVQIDTISVVERAHHHVLYSRVPDYQTDMLLQLLRDRRIFEHWSHAAAFLPMSDFRYSLPYKLAIKTGQTHWYKNPDTQLMSELLARIRADGPLRSRDLETKKSKRSGWWDWKPAKQALEQLYMQGDLMVSDREGFQKSYDLTERVLPSDVDARMPSADAFAAHLLSQQLACHGCVSLKGLTYQRRNPALRKAMKNLVNERISQRELEELRLSNGHVYIIETGALETPMPRLSERLSIVSPFDNAVIQRDRLKALFQFDYQIECYVPAAKRQYGYFSLPLLYRGVFIGRMDCKAHRKTAHLEIKSLHIETHGFEQEGLIQAWTESLHRFLAFQQCETVAVVDVYPKSLKTAFQQAVSHPF